MVRKSKPKSVVKEKREKWDRRDLFKDPRNEDRRKRAQRVGERRVSHRRKDYCPTCAGLLTATAYCPSCKTRVIKIRTTKGG